MWQKLKNYYHLTQAALAAIFFNFPSKHITVIGVTGTDGKTTTVHMIYEILKSTTPKVSMVSSIYAAIGAKTYDTGFHVTTPNSWHVQKLLRKAVDSGHKYFVMETTSHGLNQNRLAFVQFDIGVLTNVTHDHLDYHGTWENYAFSKLRLFKNTKHSVLNEDDEKSYEFLKNKVGGKMVSYCLGGKGLFTLKSFPVKLKFLGEHNLSNGLAAATVTSVLGVTRPKILKSLNNFSSPKGRLDKINMSQDFEVYIDFAHTPNALKQTFLTLRKSQANRKKSKLITVFGAAGKRDKTKRVEMGKIANVLADVIILTSEDPRDEDPIKIAMDIKKGIKIKRLGKDLFIIPERQKAIEFAINMCNEGDIVAILGKGHEKSMAIGKKETLWDEYEVVKRAIKKKLNAKKN